MSRTFAIPIYDGDKNLADPTIEPDGWIEVPSRSSGVRGLVITRLSLKSGISDEEWVLTHRATGRSLGSTTFPTIASARRAAKAVAGIVDWTDPDIQATFTTDDVRAISGALRAEASGAWGGVW